MKFRFWSSPNSQELRRSPRAALAIRKGGGLPALYFGFHRQAEGSPDRTSRARRRYPLKYRRLWAWNEQPFAPLCTPDI